MHTERTLRNAAATIGIKSSGRIELWRERLLHDTPLLVAIRASKLSDFVSAEVSEGTSNGVKRTSDHTFPYVEPSVPTWSLRAGETITERTSNALSRIRRHGELHAFTQVFERDALMQADRLDQSLVRGELIGPLEGALVAVKDIMGIEGGQMTAGTRAYVAQSNSDALVVARLRAAGAIVIGATNLHALAYGPFSTNNEYGSVHNPLNLRRVAGGSSGGSAAAVAAGLVDIAIGTDTAGSIRMPAALCGVVGMKPTYGLLPRQGVQQLAPSLDHVGPITRSVEDARLAMLVMSGNGAAAPRRQGLLVHGQSVRETGGTGFEGVTIGVLEGGTTAGLPWEMLAAQEMTERLLVASGARIVSVRMRTWDISAAIMFCTISTEALATHRELLSDRAHLLPEDVRLRLEAGMFVTAEDYSKAQYLRACLAREIDRVLQDVDVLMYPTMPSLAPSLDEIERFVVSGQGNAPVSMNAFTLQASLTGHPAVTFPIARDRNDAGVGIQFVGARGRDFGLLNVVAACEALLKQI